MLVVSELEQLPVRQARAGEPEAWDALLARYRLPLYAYVFELVHHEQTSLDIVQESFINAARHIGSLRDNARFGSWLFNIAHQKCIQQWRRQRPGEVALEEGDGAEFASDDAGPRELLVRKEQEEEFMRLLSRLTPPHRAVLLLYFVEEFSLEEIADITGARTGTVKSRLHYARKAFKKIFEENET